MPTGPAKVAILLNGPPRAGKDTAVEALAPLLGEEAEVLKFTQPVKDYTHRQAGLDCRHDAYEEQKDAPLREFGGRTPRQAYIETSARLKAEHGPDIVCRMFVEAIKNSPARIILNPDCGDDMEAEHVAEALGYDSVLVVRIHRDGHDFSQDCRTWVRGTRFATVDVHNEDGRRREYESEVVAHALAFLERTGLSLRPYAA